MNAFNIAMSRAAIGLDWSYPCLIWVADYVLDATGVDYAARWRGLAWNEHVARRELAMLSRSSDGVTAVERAMSGMAATYGWQSCDGPRQGAVMIGCYAGEDVGIPAIFDGDARWLMAGEGLAGSRAPCRGGLGSCHALPDRSYRVHLAHGGHG